MTKFGLYFCAILIILLSGCSQSGSTAFLAPSSLSGSSAKFEGDVSDPGSIAFFKNNVGDRVLFSVDQSDIDQSGRDILLAQVDWLKVNSDYKIIIEGHADERGTREYNLALGAGLSKVAGKVFRIGHLGDLNECMLFGAISGAEMAMLDNGIKVEPGSGAAAASKYWSQNVSGELKSKSVAK